MDFSKDYWLDVFEPFLDGLEQGLTPNPDVDCNRVIKFGRFRDRFFNTNKTLSFSFNNSGQQLPIDLMATGHYARLNHNRLLRAIDPVKDQSFYLASTPISSFSNVLFPIGHLLKSTVRDIASNIGLQFLLAKKESAGLCFVGKQRQFGDFISDYLNSKHGKIVAIDGLPASKNQHTISLEESPHIVGTHGGLHTLTIGQRCPIPGQKFRYYVAVKDKKSGNIGVVSDHQHPILFSHRILVRRPHWLTEESAVSLVSQVKIRSRSSAVPCKLIANDDGTLYVVFENEPVYAATPGQTIVFYQNDWCLGSAIIDKCWTNFNGVVIS